MSILPAVMEVVTCLVVQMVKCLSIPCGSASKESACNMGDLGSIPRLVRSPGEGKGYTHSSILVEENSMDCIVHRVAKSQT